MPVTTATNEGGFPDNVTRTLTENASTPKLDAYGVLVAESRRHSAAGHRTVCSMPRNTKFPVLAILATLRHGQEVFDVNCGYCAATIGRIVRDCNGVLCSVHNQDRWVAATAMQDEHVRLECKGVVPIGVGGSSPAA